MTIYHGGYQAVETPQIIEGEFAKDFGNGFYCTEMKEQAERWSNAILHLWSVYTIIKKIHP